MIIRPFRSLIWMVLLALTSSSVWADAPSAATPQLVLQSGHQVGVVGLAFSPDGALAASIARDMDARPGAPGELKLWEARTGALIRNFLGVSHAINALAFSPDGALLASAQSENAVTLWNVETGQIERRLWAPRAVSHLVWACDGTLIGAEGSARGINGKIFIWPDARSPIRYYLPSRDAKPFDSDGFNAEISPLQMDEAGAVLSVKTARAITVWDLKKRARLAQIALADNDAESSFFAPTLARDGEQLAMNVKGRATIWSARDGRQLAAWLLPFRRTLEFSPDGKTLFCRDFGDGVLERRQTLTGKLVASLPAIGENQGGVGALGFSRDGRVWATAGNFNPSMSWWRDGKKFAQIESLNTLTDLFFQPNSDLLGWSQNNGAFYFWNWKTGRLSHFFALANQESFRGLNAAFSPDGARLFVAVEAEMRCLDARTGALQWKTPQLGNFASVNLAVAPDGKTVATTAMDNPLRFWDALTGREITGREAALDPDSRAKKREAHGAMAFSEDGKWLAIGGDSNARAALFDVENRRFVRDFDTFSGASVRFSPDAQTLVISDGFQSAIEVFDAATGTRLWRHDPVFGYAFEDDQTLVLRTDKGFELTEALTGKTRAATPERAPVGRPDLADDIPQVWLVPTPDRRFWVGKGSDEVLRFWDAKTRKLAFSLANPALPDRASAHWLAFTPDGFYSGSPGIERYLRHRVGPRLLTAEQSRQFFRPHHLWGDSPSPISAPQ